MKNILCGVFLGIQCISLGSIYYKHMKPQFNFFFSMEDFNSLIFAVINFTNLGPFSGIVETLILSL